MGNVPAKGSPTHSSSYASASGAPGASTKHRYACVSVFGASHSSQSSKSDEKLKAQARHYNDLVVRYWENVDGGYLAPYGTYKLDLDFSTTIVRDLIIARRLAPFYTPLQDFNPSWTEEEIFIVISRTPLHAVDYAVFEDGDELDHEDHKIHRSLNYYRRQDQKQKQREMIKNMKEKCRRCDNEYLAARKSSVYDQNLSLRSLVVHLYKNAVECPICFLYFPEPMNYSRCCRQPICTECFVQIKRLDPQLPHDEASQQEQGGLPQTLISECASCPYCAMADFGVTYDPPQDVHVGLGTSTKPGEYKLPSAVSTVSEGASGTVIESSDEGNSPVRTPSPSTRRPRRRSSVAANSEAVVTTDLIRPDWEQKLASARSKLARKSATASAIHASSLIVTGNRAGNGNRVFIDSLEDKMIEEALRLSIIEEEERRKKSSSDMSSSA